MSGKVLLVGAGPGDPELLTLKAARAIAAADVILVDDLVNRGVLAHARWNVRVIAVGKRGGCQSTPQAFIERLMINEAKAGRCVVRLKGGDPFLFGRGGEELVALRAAGIEVEVVPGITSGMAAPLAAGISVTHRDASPGVIFVTGHEKDPTNERIDWRVLAQSGLTLVIYMGVANAARIRQRLLDGGMHPATPIAAIQSATLPTQRIVTATLAALDATLAAERITSPAILVIGEVARAAAHQLDELATTALRQTQSG
jgi:uroporphyrin-III C-methyltransferase